MGKMFGIAAVLALVVAGPAVAAPALDRDRPDHETTDPRRALDTELPTDRPIVAIVVEIDAVGGTVMLSTPNGSVALSVTPDLAKLLTVGDVVVVQFTATEVDDFPAASPRETPPGPLRQKI